MPETHDGDAAPGAPEPPGRAGSLTPEVADLVLGHLPLNVSYAAADGTLLFWQGPLFADCDPAFIGRHLDECHGPHSRALIARLQEEFRAGQRDEALFWGEDEGRLIVSRYAAVRDAHGAYRGILETMQDITDLRTIEGERHELER